MPKHYLCALAVGLLGAHGIALADTISTAGQVTLLSNAPASVVHGALVSDQTGYLFFESEEVLSAPLSVDISTPGVYTTVGSLTPSVIAAGTAIESYYYTDEPATVNPSGSREFLGGITFSTPVLGIIVETPTLNSTDAEVGDPATSYPPPTDLYSGLELNTPGCTTKTCGNDAVVLTANSQTVDIRSIVNLMAEDQVRIIVAAPETPPMAPEPGTILLAPLALLLFYPAWRRRRIAKKTN